MSDLSSDATPPVTDHAIQGADDVACCANCNSVIAGRFCGNCGQAAHVHRSLWHIAEELLHGILHFDNKIWRTLFALLRHPGKLTRDYIEGKRVTYMSPFVLFLFLNFVMFFVFGFLGNSFTEGKSYKAYFNEGLTNQLEESRSRLANLEKQRANLASTDAKAEQTISKEIADLKLRLAGYERSMAAINESSNTARAGVAPVPKFEELIYHALENPDLAIYKLKGTASKFAFILVPISLPFLWLLFIKRKDTTLFDHAVFSLYSLSFMCLVMIATTLLLRFGFSLTAWALLITMVPLQMFLQTRGTYQLSTAAALWRTLCILVIAGFSTCLYLMAILWISQ